LLRQNYITSTLEVAPYCWLFLIILFLMHMLVASYSRPTSVQLLHGWVFMIYGWLILGVDLAFYFVVKSVHYKVGCHTLSKTLILALQGGLAIAGLISATSPDATDPDQTPIRTASSHPFSHNSSRS
jgi:hypothetical protein